MAFVFVFSLSSNTHAQNQLKPKPKLVPIVLNEKTNDPKALEIAKKLDPDFFKVDLQYTNDHNDAEYFSRFINLGDKSYLISTARDTFFHCTKYGCPYDIYEQQKGNRWKLVASFTAYRLIYDANSINKSRPNIIVESYQRSSGRKVDVYLWNGITYRKIER